MCRSKPRFSIKPPRLNISLQFTVGPEPQSSARETGHCSSYHYLAKRASLLALLCYCTAWFMTLSACICYINKHSATHTSFEYKLYHTLNITSIAAENHIILEYTVLVIAFSGLLHYSSYCMAIHLFQGRWPSVGTWVCRKKERENKSHKQQQNMPYHTVSGVVMATKPRRRQWMETLS